MVHAAAESKPNRRGEGAMDAQTASPGGTGPPEGQYSRRLPAAFSLSTTGVSRCAL